MHRRLSVLLVVLLSGCSEATPPEDLGSAADFIPLVKGSTWTYDVFDGDRHLNLATRRMGGDLRRFGEKQIRYEFVYGGRDDPEEDITKSIYAMLDDGPALFYFDGFIWRQGFEPPLPLLPARVRVGAEWNWRGQAGNGRDDPVVDATLRIDAVESVTVPAGTFKTVRVSQVHEGTRIVRWFAKGVGLVREEQVLRTKSGASHRRGMILRSFAVP